jgi:hypothetical protein
MNYDVLKTNRSAISKKEISLATITSRSMKSIMTTIEAGSDRVFGCTVGTIVMVIGAAKAFVAGAVPPIACRTFVMGAVVLLLGIVAPSRLSTLNRLWSKVGTALVKVTQSDHLALLLFLWSPQWRLLCE